MNHTGRMAELTSRIERPMLVTNLSNIRYLTGFTGSNAFVLARPGAAPLFITDGRYGEVAEALLGDTAEVEVYRGAIKPVLTRVLTGLGPVDVESQHVTWDFVLDLAADVDLQPATGVVEALRAVKDDDEVDALRRAAMAGDAAFSMLESLETGCATESELGWALVEAMRAHGGQQAGWEPIVAVGANAARPHHRAGTADLEPGLLLLDYGCVVDGYHSDMTRTVWRGAHVDHTMARVHQAVLESNQAGIAAVQPGVTGDDVDEVCRAVLREYGYEDAFVHSTGHGVGVEIHEDPRLAKGADDVLEVGHVVTVEPGVYLPGIGGVRVEDMVLVTADGPDVLTSSPRELMPA